MSTLYIYVAHSVYLRCIYTSYIYTSQIL